jgi:hypothetical protein
VYVIRTVWVWVVEMLLTARLLLHSDDFRSWAINNWKLPLVVDVSTNPGGDGIVIMVGASSPVLA